MKASEAQKLVELHENKVEAEKQLKIEEEKQREAERDKKVRLWWEGHGYELLMEEIKKQASQGLRTYTKFLQDYEITNDLLLRLKNDGFEAKGDCILDSIIDYDADRFKEEYRHCVIITW